MEAFGYSIGRAHTEVRKTTRERGIENRNCEGIILKNIVNKDNRKVKKSTRMAERIMFEKIDISIIADTVHHTENLEKEI